jgi:hypothetical protein
MRDVSTHMVRVRGHLRRSRKTGKITFVRPHYRASPTRCFIATACYGDKSNEVRVLRHWRDRRLATNRLGLAFVRIYYVLSPRIALVIGRHPPSIRFVRFALRPFLRLARGHEPIAPARLGVGRNRNARGSLGRESSSGTQLRGLTQRTGTVNSREDRILGLD